MKKAHSGFRRFSKKVCPEKHGNRANRIDAWSRK
jgi:hypothetical protein